MTSWYVLKACCRKLVVLVIVLIHSALRPYVQLVVKLIAPIIFYKTSIASSVSIVPFPDAVETHTTNLLSLLFLSFGIQLDRHTVLVMARDHDSRRQLEIRDSVAWGSVNMRLYDVSNGQTSLAVQNGAVQHHGADTIIMDECADETLVVNKSVKRDAALIQKMRQLHTTEQAQDAHLKHILPCLRIAPVPSRLHMYKPPVNYGNVEKSAIFRSGYPEPENYDFLASLNLKTILTLVPEPLSKGYLQFMHKNGISHVQIHIPANKDGHIKITAQRMYMTLSVVLDRKHHPLLIHCNRGKHRTGCVTACLRKVQEASDEFAIAEYRDYSFPKCRIDDMRFIESFDPLGLATYAQSHGWPVTPPNELSSDDESYKTVEDGFAFSLEDIAAIKVPEEPDHSL